MKRMKRLLMAMGMIGILPVGGWDLAGICTCNAEENDTFKDFNVPNVTPIYSSYYDDAREMLYIYGYLSGKNVESTIVTTISFEVG